MVYMNDFKIRGFTLLEIMIVISIMGILILVTSHNFSVSKDEFKLRSTARNCMANIRYAQQLSIDTKEEHGVYFTAAGYEIKKGATEVVKLVSFNNYVQYQEIQGIIADQIVFKTDGSPYEAGKIDLKSTSSGTHVYLNVTPNTGEVSLLWN